MNINTYEPIFQMAQGMDRKVYLLSQGLTIQMVSANRCFRRVWCVSHVDLYLILSTRCSMGYR